MDTYSYRAVSDHGRDKRGVVEAESKEEAARKITENGLVPIEISIQRVWDRDINIPFLNQHRKISARDLSVFCRQFASILRAGVSAINALDMLGEQTENKTLKNAIKEVQSNVEKGENLANSMRLQKDVFPSLLINMVEAGESSGSLENAIERMAIQFEKDAKLKGMVRKAMIYPIILCIVAVGVVCVMMMYVIPSFMSMFEDLDAQLPVLTRVIIAISQFMKNYWYLLLGGIVILIIAYRYYKSTPDGRKNIDSFKLHIPVFGKLATKTACARFSRTLATLLKSGMPMIDAIEITANTMDNVVYKETLLRAKTGVGLGIELSNELKVSGNFPLMVVHMTNIGEKTGSLEEMLNNIANYYDEEVEITTQQATALMEPLIILIMAVLVGGIIFSIYGPMITLYNTL